jgi:DNA repair ATPase RecN
MSSYLMCKLVVLDNDKIVHIIGDEFVCNSIRDDRDMLSEVIYTADDFIIETDEDHYDNRYYDIDSIKSRIDNINKELQDIKSNRSDYSSINAINFSCMDISMATDLFMEVKNRIDEENHISEDYKDELESLLDAYNKLYYAMRLLEDIYDDSKCYLITWME